MPEGTAQVRPSGVAVGNGVGVGTGVAHATSCPEPTNTVEQCTVSPGWTVIDAAETTPITANAAMNDNRIPNFVMVYPAWKISGGAAYPPAAPPSSQNQMSGA